ncbi:MAG: GNAT family N-acetyltransferase [Acidobacteriia bacterium]|nr:GNAT family N-acetyltransferase [Terriglobia bacterium]
MTSFRHARVNDVEAIVWLINAAFQVERFFKERDRTNPEMVRSLLEKGKFLLAEDGPSLAGCVYVELRGERGYLGLLSVDPARQRSGLGRQLVAAAEDFFRGAGCRFSDLSIVNVRKDLPGYYRSLGYVETGTMPFTADEPLKLPVHFIMMSKPLG